MANVVAYPELALEKLTGLDPNEDARDFLGIVEKKVAFSLGTRPADAGDEQDAYDNRQRILFGSILRGRLLILTVMNNIVKYSLYS